MDEKRYISKYQSLHDWKMTDEELMNRDKILDNLFKKSSKKAGEEDEPRQDN